MNMIIGRVLLRMFGYTHHPEETELVAHEGSHHHEGAKNTKNQRTVKIIAVMITLLNFPSLINLSLIVLPALVLYFYNFNFLLL